MRPPSSRATARCPERRDLRYRAARSSLRRLRPLASRSRYRFVRSRVRRANHLPTGPSYRRLSTARVPSPDGLTLWLAYTHMPGAPLFHVKLRPGSSAITFQTAGGNRGCLTSARMPTRTGPRPSSRILRTDGVHSCHRSASDMTAHTTSGGAAMSTDRSNSAIALTIAANDTLSVWTR